MQPLKKTFFPQHILCHDVILEFLLLLVLTAGVTRKVILRKSGTSPRMTFTQIDILGVKNTLQGKTRCDKVQRNVSDFE